VKVILWLSVLMMGLQVMVGDSACTGVGPNKKLAKREAAEQMLLMLGYSLTPPPPAKPALKTLTDTAATGGAASTVNVPATGSDKHVTFAEREMSTSRQRTTSYTTATTTFGFTGLFQVVLRPQKENNIG